MSTGSTRGSKIEKNHCALKKHLFYETNTHKKEYHRSKMTAYHFCLVRTPTNIQVTLNNTLKPFFCAKIHVYEICSYKTSLPRTSKDLKNAGYLEL